MITDAQTILCLDLGTKTGRAVCGAGGHVTSNTEHFPSRRFEGGGMRYLRFKKWLSELKRSVDEIDVVHFEELRRHIGTDAAHVYGGFLATLTAWCEHYQIPYEGIPVGTIKKATTGKGNASKEEMIAAMRSKGRAPRDDNEADALSILHMVVKEKEKDNGK
ncbi:phage related protein [Bartonella australis AUST/NH1]|uniref:Phage related protein n=1 Tax=Bartonella australis (strain Aust/NH1) TaxID=1094489 RepID=M1NZJ4_BARAA|nr:phage related protein [Bartonella australis]AGF74847.1 phage related protein [Bartonella australis AUST/NH1]